jgi:hypothetical protein
MSAPAPPIRIKPRPPFTFTHRGGEAAIADVERLACARLILQPDPLHDWLGRRNRVDLEFKDEASCCGGRPPRRTYYFATYAEAFTVCRRIVNVIS